jgi:hypothetical protein
MNKIKKYIIRTLHVLSFITSFYLCVDLLVFLFVTFVSFFGPSCRIPLFLSLCTPFLSLFPCHFPIDPIVYCLCTKLNGR